MIRALRAYFFFLFIGLKLYIYFRWKKPGLSSQEENLATGKIWAEVGKKSKKKFLQLGGIYIKLGQFLANAAHLFPDEFIQPLQELQDQVPPQSFSKIIRRFREEMNSHPDDLFDSFEREPIASASTAQVHRAIFQSKEVAVKILYPGIENSVQKDMKTIFQILRLIHKYLFPFPYQDIHRQMDVLFHQEMDMSLERENLKKMAWFLKDEKHIFVPGVISEFESRGILVTEFIRGKKFSHAPQVVSKNSPQSHYIQLLVRALLLMVFRFRFFHADPHPGNLIITEDGRLCFLDFGAVGTIQENEEEALVSILQASMKDDYKGILEGLEAMGVMNEESDREEILRVIQYSMQKIQNVVGGLDYFRNIGLNRLDIESDLKFIKSMKTGLKDLVRTLQPPDNYIALQRTTDLVIGNIALIDPYHSVFDYAEKPFRNLILKERFLPWIWSLF